MYNTFSFTFVLFSEPITFLLYSLSMQALQKIGFKNVKVQHYVIMIASQRKRKLLCSRIYCEMVSRQNVTVED